MSHTPTKPELDKLVSHITLDQLKKLLPIMVQTALDYVIE